MPIDRKRDGYSALDKSDPLANFDIGNPRKYAVLMEDFLGYDIAQAAGNPYTFTATNCVDTIAGPTGIVVLTLGGADNDAGQLQLTEVPIALTAGKKMFFEARFNLTLASGGTVAANEMFVGLASEQTTTNFMNAGGTALAVDDCVGVVKYDTGASMNFVSRKTDAETEEDAVLTPTDGTYFRVTIVYDGSKLTMYRDGGEIASISSNIPTADMTPTLFVKAGEAKANILKCDYIFVAVER